MHALEDRNHSNRLLQAAYAETPDAFAFVILEHTHPDYKYKREQVWIDRMLKRHELYNLDLSIQTDLHPVNKQQETTKNAIW